MKVRLFKNGYGDTCTEDFDPMVDAYDYWEDLMAQECAMAALDDYMYGCGEDLFPEDEGVDEVEELTVYDDYDCYYGEHRLQYEEWT